jgi:hypothetical protein
MKSDPKHPIDRKVLDEVRYECKQWRRLVSRCAKTDDLIPSAAEEQYKVVHGRILAGCRNLADQQSLPEFRRRIALELDELLRPWSSTKSLTEAPPHLVDDLVRKETTLEQRLRGKRRSNAAARLKWLLLTACIAAVAGIALTLFLEWSSSDASRPVFNSLWGFATNIGDYIRQSSFTEQFAIAVLFSWLFGTWLLSRVSTS